MEIDQVRVLLTRLQDGYTRRDVSELDDVMELFIPGDGLEVIGTNTVAPGQGEWCRGREATRKLIEEDWNGWGDVVFDVQGAHISVNGDVAWLATTAEVTMTMSAESCYQGFLASAKGTLERDEVDARKTLLKVVRLGTDILLELQEGDTFVWPIRFTAVAVKGQDGWQFSQMQFSFPNTRFPDVRYTDAR
jgi:hypothetical protein